VQVALVPQAIPRVVEVFVDKAATFADEPDQTRLAAALLHRLAAAPEIVARYLPSLRSRT
jgi:hypothetical protein